MNAVYRALGISKQSYHQRMKRYMQDEDNLGQLLPLIQQVRRDHPEMGAREIYHMLQPDFLGRDRFEAFCFENGFRIARKRSFIRTTNSSGVIRFPNYLEGLELTGVNQVWVSDITYYLLPDRAYYLTFIMDLYSRYIVGHSVSRTLLTEQTTLPALRRALRDNEVEPGMIFHSDGGGQYYCNAFLDLTESRKIINSMGTTPYENPNAERINGTIKNSYLKYFHPQNFSGLVRETARSVKNYNHRPHSSLRRATPTSIHRADKFKCRNVDKASKFTRITAALPTFQHLV